MRPSYPAMRRMSGLFKALPRPSRTKEERQRCKDEDHDLVGLQSSYQHYECEYSPHEQESGQCPGPCPYPWTPSRAQWPEHTIGSEGYHPEGVALLPLHQADYYLGQPSVENSYCQYHASKGEESGVVQIQQDRGHSKAHQSQRGGIGLLDYRLPLIVPFYDPRDILFSYIEV